MTIHGHVVVGGPNLNVDGVITVRLQNGKHFTYRLKTVKSGALEGKRIVELMIGPDNESSYKGWAFVDDRGDVRIWKRQWNSAAFQKHKQLLTGKAEEHVSGWLQSGRCLKCGRLLTTPESIAAGVGPVCAGRV